MGYTGSETRSIAQTIDKPCVLSKGPSFDAIFMKQRGAVVEWLEQLGYGAESRCIA